MMLSADLEDAAASDEESTGLILQSTYRNDEEPYPSLEGTSRHSSRSRTRSNNYRRYSRKQSVSITIQLMRISIAMLVGSSIVYCGYRFAQNLSRTDGASTTSGGGPQQSDGNTNGQSSSSLKDYSLFSVHNNNNAEEESVTTSQHDDDDSTNTDDINESNNTVPRQRIAVLGERNSGTPWLIETLSKCYPDVEVSVSPFFYVLHNVYML